MSTEEVETLNDGEAASDTAEGEVVDELRNEPGAEIEVHRPTKPAATLLPTTGEWHAILSIAEVLCQTELVPKPLRGKGRANDVALILLYGRDVGVTASVALSRIYVIEGRPSMSAELMLGQIRKAGHRVDSVCTKCGKLARDEKAREVCEAGRQHGKVTLERGVELRGKRCDDGAVEYVSWELADAAQSELVVLDQQGNITKPQREKKHGANGDYWIETGTKKNWWRNPKQMLRWRAISELARILFPDVLNGITYTGEELGVEVDDAGDPIIDVDGYDVPPSERNLAQTAPLPETHDEHDNTGTCCRARINERIAVLPDELRKQAVSTLRALVQQARLHKMGELQEGDRDTVDTVLRPLEQRSAKVAGGPQTSAQVGDKAIDDAEVVEPCEVCNLVGQHEPGCPKGPPNTTPDVNDTPAVADAKAFLDKHTGDNAQPPCTVDAAEAEAPFAPVNTADIATIDAPAASDEVGHCETCGEPIYREAGMVEWHHADTDDPAESVLDQQHTPRPAAASSSLPAVPAQNDIDREAELESQVAKLAYSEVKKRLETAGQPTNQTPKRNRAQLVQYLFVSGASSVPPLEDGQVT